MTKLEIRASIAADDMPYIQFQVFTEDGCSPLYGSKIRLYCEQWIAKYNALELELEE